MTPYNPLDKRHLAESVVRALLERPLEPLPPVQPFEGAGIYAIYYTGPFPAYARISKKDPDIPIYVGKVVPLGARKGGRGREAAAGPVLYQKLVQHANSIDQATNLRREDFLCRYLVVEDIWIPLGEQLLIKKFTPVWNCVVDGFEIDDPEAEKSL